MESPESFGVERHAIQEALRRLQRRMRVNRALHAVALLAALALVALLTWRLLAWMGGTLPAASALVVLLAILGAIALLGLLGASLLRGTLDAAHAASEADRRAGLHDELTSAHWFMGAPGQQPPASRGWVELQLQRAARTAQALPAERVVPLRLSRGLLGGLAAGLAVLVAVWSATPLAPAHSAAATVADATAEEPQVQALRELIARLPQTEARRKLEAALETLQTTGASPDERRRAAAAAQDAVDQIRMSAATSREGLQKLSQMLAGQAGMEEVAEALAKGDAKRAAELLTKIQAENQQAAGSGNAPQPSEAVNERSLEQAMVALSDTMAEPQGGRPTVEAMKLTVDRLNEIAKELSAANYVNESWKEVRGPQLSAAQNAPMAAGRFDQQQDSGAVNPSPSTGDSPMGGGTMFRAAAVARGEGTEEQEGGTRMGDALGEGRTDPLLGDAGARLDAQLKQQALTGQEDKQSNPDQSWFYADSQKRGAQAVQRSVQAPGRYAEADASGAGGISIKHRQITKDFFMNRPEAAK
jgi:uncharacterized membrane protein